MDENDLIQEMSIHLWKKWKKDKFKGQNESYLLQGCWFHLKNHLRVISDNVETVSLNEPVNGGDIPLNELIVDESAFIPGQLEYKILINRIKSNGLSKREKEVFELYMEGHTLREIGEKMNISFVMVSKIQKNICRKYRDRFIN